MRKMLIKMVGTVFIVLIIFNIFLTDTNICLALSDVTVNPDIWLNGEQDVGDSALNTKMQPILTMIRVVGIIVSVLTLAIIALRIMFGSVEEKSQYKQTLMPWVVGAFMVFSMTTIPSIIYDVVDGNNTGEKSEYPLEEKIYQDYCINGYKIVEYASSSSKCEKGESCGCEGKIDSNNTWKCPNCARRLSQMREYEWYCSACGKFYR